MNLSQRMRARLTRILTEDRASRGALVRRLQEMRTLEGVPVFSETLRMLAHLEVPEREAEALLVGIEERRGQMSERLGRDPGLPVAALDFLANDRNLLVNPAIVEWERLETTERSAVTDGLTELYDRRYFDAALRNEVRRSGRYQLDLSLLLVDVDEFRSVNDLYGRQVGDLALARLGRILTAAVRESDIAARDSGDRFAILMAETDRLGAVSLGERIRERVRTEFAGSTLRDVAVLITVSCGVASYPADGSTADGLLSRADESLTLSKRLGRNRVTAYHSERRADVRFPVRAATRAMLVVRAGDPPVGTRPLDLSSRGARLGTDVRLTNAQEVRLELARGSGRERVAARVVRVEDRDPLGEGSVVALQFDRPLPRSSLLRFVVRGAVGPQGPLGGSS